MPHGNGGGGRRAGSGGGDDLASTDEVKVYKDEGCGEEENKASENLSEDKLGLVIETEEVCRSLCVDIKAFRHRVDEARGPVWLSYFLPSPAAT